MPLIAGLGMPRRAIVPRKSDGNVAKLRRMDDALATRAPGR